MNTPSSNGHQTGDGRNGKGQFAVGNPGGPGNPSAGQVAKHRAKFYAALRDDDVERALTVIRTIMDDDSARPSDRLAAAKELLDRVVGRVAEQDMLDRVASLEQLLSDRSPNGRR